MEDSPSVERIAALLIQVFWRAQRCRRACDTTRTLRELCTCAVCNDECARIVRCPKGHGCCMGCNMSMTDPRCPICREPRGTTTDPTLPLLLRVNRFPLRCNTCRKQVYEHECELHRAWCPAHLFLCPWANCQKCFPAHELAEHIQHHTNVHCLQRELDSMNPMGGYEYHAVLLLTRTSEQIIFCVEDTTVVLQVAVRRVITAGGGFAHAPLLFHMNARAYYASSASPALKTRVRQLPVHACADGSEHVEEHCMDIVPPMLASSESIVLGSIGGWMSARSILQDGQLEPNMLVLLRNGRPSPGVNVQVRQLGIKDAPRLPPQSREEVEGGTMAAIVHISFRTMSTSIGHAVLKWT